MSAPVSTTNTSPTSVPQKNQRQMKPQKCPLGKSQRRRLWANLRKYCDDLFAVGFTASHRFDPPQHAIAMFAELGLRHPRNPRALRKFYDNFIPRCGHLAENGAADKKRKWKPKSGCNGTPPPPPSMASMSSMASMPMSMGANSSMSPLSVPAQAQSVQMSQAQTMQRQMGHHQQQQQQMHQQHQHQQAMHQMKQQQQAMDAQAMQRWLASNCFEVQTPSALHGVPINRSPMRRDGLNVLSTNYSTKHPDPAQALQRNESMIVFGTQRDAQKFGAQAQQQRPAQSQSQSQSQAMPADPAFMREMANKRMMFVPVPPCMVGSTLADTPQLSQAGINALSVNMRVLQPSVMAKRRFVVGDTLICLFDDSFVDKHDKLTRVFEEVQRTKQQFNL